MKIFYIYSENNIIPPSISINTINDLLKTYPQDDFTKRMIKIKEIYKNNGKITKEDFDIVFSEYSIKLKDYEKSMKLFLIIIM
jgi:hypothetical protein